MGATRRLSSTGELREHFAPLGHVAEPAATMASALQRVTSVRRRARASARAHEPGHRSSVVDLPARWRPAASDYPAPHRPLSDTASTRRRLP